MWAKSREFRAWAKVERLSASVKSKKEWQVADPQTSDSIDVSKNVYPSIID